MKDPTETIAERHVAQSLEELTDDEKRKAWESGERARDQAAEIVSSLVADVIKELEGDKPNERK